MRKFIVSSSPHIRGEDNTGHIMIEVVLALLPAAIAGGIIFGGRAYAVLLTSVISCVVAELLWQTATKQKITTADFSAAVTGLLLGLSLPTTIPLWMIGVGGVFAMIIVKQLFGGLGHNFMNPALAARAFMLASWPTAMTTWAFPENSFFLIGATDTTSGATVLAQFKQGTLDLGIFNSILDLSYYTPACIGETTAILLILGGIYLLIRKIITWQIPVTYLLTVFVIGAVSGDGISALRGAFHVLNGGVLIGAIFMATDYVTSPMTKKGQLIMGFGCGLITMIIRLYGGYPEGVTYAILLMNILTPLIDKFTFPKKYGTVKGGV
jgi:electron transport complex protein RnfD